MNLSSFSMKFRLSFPILAGAAIVLLSLAYVQGNRMAKSLDDVLHSKGENFANFLQKVSLPYLKNFDLSAIEGFASEATKDPEVGFIAFYDDKKKPLSDMNKEPSDLSPFYVFERSLVRDDSKVMGNLKIGYRKETLLRVQRQNSLMGISGILIALCLIGGIVMVVARRLERALSAMISEMSAASEKLTEVGSRLSETSELSSHSTAEAAASLEETSASLQELSGTVKSNADKSREAADLSQASRGAVQEGKGEITKLAGAMTDIADSSKRIAEIIDVIEDIAFQTNLLALNAAVEAARAGDHGKGFAVVAEAVRSLAQRTTSASKDISALIRDSSGKTEHGVQVVKRSGDVLEAIVKSVTKVSELNIEIAKASQEQSTGIRHINNAMGQLDTITQKNAANADQVAQSSVEMMSQSQVLLEFVDKLVVLTTGERGVGDSGNEGDGSRPELRSQREQPREYHARSRSRLGARQRQEGVSQRHARLKQEVRSQNEERFPLESPAPRKTSVAEVVPLHEDESGDRKVS